MARAAIALIGAGSMGSNHARTIAESTFADLAVVIDTDEDAAERLAARHHVGHATHPEAALNADAVIIATSTATHAALAAPLLEAGIPVLVEKPLALSLADVDKLLGIAERTDTPLMCGLVERFNPAVRTAVHMIDGPVHHVTAIRHSPPAPRIRSSVVPDLLLHDLDLVLRVIGGNSAALCGSGCLRPSWSRFNEIADCSLIFEGGLATLSANRMSQHKVRSISINSPGSTIDVDLMRQNVTVFHSVSQEIAHDGGGHTYRSSTEIEIPFVHQTGEPLALQLAHFVGLVSGTGDPAAERASLRPPHQLMHEVEAGPTHAA